MSHPEGGGQPGVDPLRDPGQRLRRTAHLLGERSHHGRAEHPVADRHLADVTRHLHDLAGVLAARYERGRHRHLIAVGDKEDVGEVDRRRLNGDASLSGERSGSESISWISTTSGGP